MNGSKRLTRQASESREVMANDGIVLGLPGSLTAITIITFPQPCQLPQHDNMAERQPTIDAIVEQSMDPVSKLTCGPVALTSSHPPEAC